MDASHSAVSPVKERRKTSPTSKPSAVPGETKTRTCLVCKEQFPSEWAGQRVCPKCKSTAAWRTG